MCHRASSQLLSFIQFLWRLIRLPILIVLVALEPIVVLIFGGLAILGVLTTLFFSAISLPHFPAWTMLSISIGFGLVLILYTAAIRLFSA